MWFEKLLGVAGQNGQKRKYLITKTHTATALLVCLLAPMLLWSETAKKKIVLIGDSITEGSGESFPTYRKPLWYKLIENGYTNIDFVGSQNSNLSGDWDQDHEGHWGWCADQLAALLPSWLQSYTPDIAVIHIGTNDLIHQSQSPEGITAEIGGLIDILRADNAAVKIVLSQIIPMSPEYNCSSYVPGLNNQIVLLAGKMNSEVSPIVVVDQYTGYDCVADSRDGVHPNSVGEEKMAQRCFETLDYAFKNGWGDEGATPLTGRETYFRAHANKPLQNASYQGTFYTLTGRAIPTGKMMRLNCAHSCLVSVFDARQNALSGLTRVRE